MPADASIILVVGLPGAGKTTLARRIAAERGILRLTPDDWMGPLFGDLEAGGHRTVLEGRMIWVAHEVARSGSSVVLDFGCWAAVERYAVRSVADCAGASFELRVVELPESERRARARRRYEQDPETEFPMTEAEHDRYLTRWQRPTEEEVALGPYPPVPDGFDSWPHWASGWWPTLPRLDR